MAEADLFAVIDDTVALYYLNGADIATAGDNAEGTAVLDIDTEVGNAPTYELNGPGADLFGDATDEAINLEPGDYVTTGALTAQLQSDPFTFEIIFKPDRYDVSSSQTHIIQMGSYGSGRSGWGAYGSLIDSDHPQHTLQLGFAANAYFINRVTVADDHADWDLEWVWLAGIYSSARGAAALAQMAVGRIGVDSNVIMGDDTARTNGTNTAMGTDTDALILGFQDNYTRYFNGKISVFHYMEVDKGDAWFQSRFNEINAWALAGGIPIFNQHYRNMRMR